MATLNHSEIVHILGGIIEPPQLAVVWSLERGEMRNQSQPVDTSLKADPHSPLFTVFIFFFTYHCSKIFVREIYEFQ